MKKLAMIIILSITIPLFCWEKSLELSYDLTMNNYSDNWAGGDASGITWTAGVNFLVQKQLVDWIHMKNTAKLSFGHTHNQNNDTKKWLRPIKSNDIIDLENIERFTFGSFVDPFVAFRFESQFLDASDKSNERIINPIEITESAGLAKVIIKNEKQELITRFGGALRQNINRDEIDSLDNKETVTTNDGGLEFVTELRTPILNETVDFESKLTFYKALYYSEEDEVKDDAWKTPHIDWDTYLTAKITNIISVKLNVQLLYDEQIDKAGRHKEILSIGLIYTPF